MGHIRIRLLMIIIATCTMGEASLSAQAARSVHEIVSALRRFEEISGHDVDVPPAVSENLTALKHALRDLIVEIAGAPETVATDPNILAARVVERLGREDVPVGDEGGYGAIESIELRRPKEYPDWLVATTGLSIPYGLDVSLYLFERQGGTWKHALTVESNGYKTIRGAQGWLKYRVAPPIPGAKPYLVTAEVSPSDVSVWQALRLKVFRVGAKPEAPLILANRALGYCLDEPYYLTVRATGFGLIYLGNVVDLELAGWRGVHYLEYAVSARRASIVRETAVDPYRLIQKWASESWPVASRLADPSAKDGVRAWHQRFRESGWACGLGQIRLGQRRQGDHEQLLAEAGCEEDDNRFPSAHVLLAPQSDGFHIASVSGTEATLPETGGYTVYSAGRPGLTDPIPETVVQPKLPADTPPDVPSPVRLRLSITVDEDGNVGSVSVLDWPEDRLKIVLPAIQAVRKWKYRPGMKDGKPVKVSLQVEVVFER